MIKDESVIAALVIFNLKQGVTLTDIRTQYLDLTGQFKFYRVLGTDERLQKEFLRYHKAYISLVRHYGEKGADTGLEYYPPDQLFQFRLNQAVFLFLNRDYLKASEKFQELNRLDPKNPLVLLYLGVLLLKRKSHYAAEKYFKEVVKMDRDNDDGWFYLGESYLRIGEHRKALTMFETAGKLDPARPDVAGKIREIKEHLEGPPGGSKNSLFNRLLKKVTRE